MRNKMRGWKEGILSKDLMNMGECKLSKGSLVRYKKIKTQYDSDMYRATEYEWCYVDEDNSNLIRSRELIIEEQPHIIEPNIKIN